LRICRRLHSTRYVTGNIVRTGAGAVMFAEVPAWTVDGFAEQENCRRVLG